MTEWNILYLVHIPNRQDILPKTYCPNDNILEIIEIQGGFSFNQKLQEKFEVVRRLIIIT